MRGLLLALCAAAAWASPLAFSVSAVAADDVLGVSPSGFRFFKLPSLREQAKIQDEWLDKRVTTVLPMLMTKHNVDTWIISQLEYAEDTTFKSFKTATTFAARRRSLWVFHLLNAKTVEQFKYVDNTDQIWVDFRNTLDRINPQRILLNINDTLAFADGLHAGEREILEKNMGPEYLKRVVRAAELPVEYIETRVPGMAEEMTKLTETVWAIIDQGFSNQVIVPGKTTTEDVVWWFREKIVAMNMTTWFQPSVDVSRFNPNGQAGKPATQLSGNSIIMKGDMLWCDFGVIAMGLHTDTQHLGYVLKDGETDVPAGLLAGLQRANSMQDAVTNDLRVGKTGNEVLFSSAERVARNGVTGTIYSHPIGDWGHSAGPLIGYSNIQTGVPVRGDLKVVPNSWFSIELQATAPVAEWGGQTVSFRQEEDAYVGDASPTGAKEVRWAFKRQTKFHLVK